MLNREQPRHSRDPENQYGSKRADFRGTGVERQP